MLSLLTRMFSILTRRERITFFSLVGMMIVMGFLDALSIASVIPFLAILLDPGAIDDSAFLSSLKGMIGAETNRGFLVAVGYGVLAVVIGSIAFKIGTTYAISRYSLMRSASFSTQLIRKYLRQPYAWFLGKNSSDLARTILSEVDQAVGQVLQPAMQMMGASVTMAFIAGTLLVVNPVITLAAALVLGASYGLIFLIVRRYLSRAGQLRFRENQRRFRAASDAFGSVKDTKLLGLETEFVRRYERPAFDMARHRAVVTVVGQAPRQLIEGVVIAAALLYVLSLTSGSDTDLGAAAVSGLIGTIGLFAFAGTRLFPALQTVYQTLTQIRFGRPAFDALYHDLRTPLHEPPPPDDPRAAPLRLQERLELDEVRYVYPGAARPALQGLSLAIEANTTVAFVGGTGAGKTTVADLVLGLLTPTQGALRADGRRIERANLRAWQRQIGYVPQHIHLTDDSVAANIAFGLPAERADREQIEAAARIARIHDFIVEELPQGYDTLVGDRGVRLSGGQRQRIGIARALYHDPSLLVLDEATSALDNLTERAVMDAVATLSRQKTIIMIAHRLSTVRNCDRIFLIEKGRLAAAGTYEELIERSSTFKAMAEA